MGFWSQIKSLTSRLTETDRQNIWKLWGSFYANRIGMNHSSYLEHGYESNVDVFSIIQKIVQSAQKANWVIEEKSSEGWTELQDTEFHEFMEAPNQTKGYTWNDIIEQMMVYLTATGNTYLYKLNPEGFSLPSEIDVLPSANVCPLSTRDFFDPLKGYEMILEGTKTPFTPEEISHIRYFNPSYKTIEKGLVGLSPIQVASMVVQTGNDRWEADANLLQNRGAIGMVTDKSNMPMTDNQSKEVQEKFDRDTAGPSKFGRIKVTNKDLQFIQMAMSSADLQIIEKGIVNLRTLCNVFGADSSMFNDPENKKYDNVKQADKAMYTNSVMPIVNGKLQPKINSFLVKDFFKSNKIRLRADFSHLEALQEDFHEKAKTYTMLKNAGIQTANQAANALNLDPNEDENADKLIVTNNLVTIDQIGQNENA